MKQPKSTSKRPALTLKQAVKPPRRRVQRDPNLTRRYYRAMRRFNLWSAPGCDPSPLLEATFLRLAANDEEPSHE